MKKKLLLLLLLAIALVLTTTSCGGRDTITGNEWLLMQEQCFTDIEAFANGMDEVYTLYIIESISAEDFLVELETLSKQYSLLIAFYDEMKENNPIEPETHSFLSREGTKAIENIYVCLGEILVNSLDEKGQPLPPDQLSYRYLAYRQTLKGHITTYTTAIIWYKMQEGEIEAPEETTDNSEE